MKKLPKEEKVAELENEDKELAKEKSLEKDIQKQESFIKRLLLRKRFRTPSKKEAEKKRKQLLKKAD
ncbi:hypothetical protein KY362_05115 [Candidatus Woesearchaeota archaeon]|nr:hypothetical protein [Candidatus Woesearchaeota archaeon]